MKTVILCGGKGTRLSEETRIRPKPMVEIGDRPILWHLMNYYASQGFSDFTLALGYQAVVIKEYFSNYYALNSDLSVDLATGKAEYFAKRSLNWKVDLIDTGLETMTGGRLLRLKDQLKNEGTFFFTYGDGLSNVNLKKLLEFHKSHGRAVTVTAVHPTPRFGGLEIKENKVIHFKEKPQQGEGWINGGFFVMNSKVFDYLSDDATILERDPMEDLVKDGQLMAYEHPDFWQCMDTIRDRQLLEEHWESGEAPWKSWK